MPSTWWPSMPPGNPPPATPLAPPTTGSVNLRTPSPTSSPPIRKRRWRIFAGIWRPPPIWIAWSAATWATARPRWPSAPPSRRRCTDSKQVAYAPADHRRRPSSIITPSCKPLRRLSRGGRRSSPASARPQAASAKPSPGAADGTADVLVGTHPHALAKDVRFHDLGLLIVDEEQRFGVAHKEADQKPEAGPWTCSTLSVHAHSRARSI